MELRKRGLAGPGETAQALLNRNDALSSSEQEKVVSYLAESNDFSNKCFLVILALLHGIVGGIYVFLFAAKDQTFTFLMNPLSPPLLLRMCMLVSAFALLAGGVFAANFSRTVSRGSKQLAACYDSWLAASPSERDLMVRKESSDTRKMYEAEAKRHKLLACLSLIPACVFGFEVVMGGFTSAADVLDVVAAVWQPLLHFAVQMIVLWMFDSSVGVLKLLASAYRHEGA